MMKEIPKHKGTDHLQADLKAKIAKLRREITTEKSSGKKTRGLRIPRQGAGTAILLGTQRRQEPVDRQPDAGDARGGPLSVYHHRRRRRP